MKEKVLSLQNKFNTLVEQAKLGEITFEEVLQNLNIRDFLPNDTVITTLWHIEDLRKKFPENTPDKVLIEVLHDIQGKLEAAAISAGWYVIDEIDVEEYIKSAL